MGRSLNQRVLLPSGRSIPRPSPLSWHDGQRDVGGVLRAMQDSLQRWFEFGILGNPVPRIGVTVEAREVAG